MATEYIYHEFEHLPTIIRARYIERDMWVTDENGRPKLVEAGCWEAWGVDNKQYFIAFDSFMLSYKAATGTAEFYLNEVVKNR